MVYPIMIGTFAILVLIGMVIFLIPMFASMYKDLGNAKLPALTRIMVARLGHLPRLLVHRHPGDHRPRLGSPAAEED